MADAGAGFTCRWVQRERVGRALWPPCPLVSIDRRALVTELVPAGPAQRPRVLLSMVYSSGGNAGPMTGPGALCAGLNLSWCHRVARVPVVPACRV